jgi:hypothetical protein
MRADICLLLIKDSFDLVDSRAHAPTELPELPKLPEFTKLVVVCNGLRRV